MSSHRPTKFDSTACTVVVVDMQNDFCHPDGKLVRRGVAASPDESTIARLAQFLDEARGIGVPIVWIQTSHNENTNSEVWLARHSRYLSPPAAEIRESNCLTGSWGEEFYGVEPIDGEPVVKKIRYSGFIGTSLESVLRTLGRSSLLFTGTATNGCVESTLREALFRDFHVSLIADCCFAAPPEAQAPTLDNVSRFFGPVVDHGEVLEAWREG